jgi:hypothetical protein
MLPPLPICCHAATPAAADCRFLRHFDAFFLHVAAA